MLMTKSVKLSVQLLILLYLSCSYREKTALLLSQMGFQHMQRIVSLVPDDLTVSKTVHE